MKITGVRARDIRFPTSRNLDGSDALNVGDYSATYVIVETDGGLEGHGLTFTNGRGNELTVAAVHALQHHVIGLSLDEIKSDMRGLYRKLTVDPQLRWLGPEKGILHMATGALLNAVWDLWAKAERKPLWKLLVDLTPEQLVSTIDFSYLSDALTPEQALELLRKQQPTRAAREAEMRAQGYPAYTTSTGWLGYSDEKVRRLCEEAVAAGWTHLKMKVGQDLEMNRRRAGLIRSIIGKKGKLMMDANQCWDVPEAIRQMHSLAEFDPWWIEEPTSPDDVLGHAAIAREVAPIRVATGEACQNRVIFKQLLQAGAIGFCQVDSCRVGGVNEVLSIMLLATRFGIPICPHAGGVGLCEYVQHLAIFDYIALSGTLEDRVCEYVDHLHEHFVDPVRIVNGRYAAPLAPGLQHHDEAAVARRLRVPQRTRVAGRGRDAVSRVARGIEPDVAALARARRRRGGAAPHARSGSRPSVVVIVVAIVVVVVVIFFLLRLHLDDRSHPGMDTALEAVVALGEAAHSRPGAGSEVDGDRGRRVALRRGGQALVEGGHPASTELRHLREGVDAAAPVPDLDRLAFLDLEIGRVVAPRLMSDDGGGQRTRRGAGLGNELGVRDVPTPESAAAAGGPRRVVRVAVVPDGHVLVVPVGRHRLRGAHARRQHPDSKASRRASRGHRSSST